MTYIAADERVERPALRSRQMDDLPHGPPGDSDFTQHLQTYRAFVKGVMLFAAHALVILVLLYYFLM